jgi:acetoin utilization protein AcuB
MNLRALVTSVVVTVGPDDSLDTAISQMEEHDIHHLPVVEHGNVVGMLSDRDLLLSVGWMLSRDREVDQHTRVVSGPVLIRDVMSTPVISVPEAATISEAAAVLFEHRIGAVPVLSGERLAGLLSRSDLLKHSLELALGDIHFGVLHERIEKHMRASVSAAHVSDSIQTVVTMMHEKNLRHLPVLGEDFVIGIVSDRDIRRAYGKERIEDDQAQAQGQIYIGATAVAEIMSTNVVTTRPEAKLTDAAEKMHLHRISALPVVKHNHLAGIITDSDIIRLISKSS